LSGGRALKRKGYGDAVEDRSFAMLCRVSEINVSNVDGVVEANLPVDVIGKQ